MEGKVGALDPPDPEPEEPKEPEEPEPVEPEPESALAEPSEAPAPADAVESLVEHGLEQTQQRFNG